MAARKSKSADSADSQNAPQKLTTATTIIVYHPGDGTVSVSSALPPGVPMTDRFVERFRVHGTLSLVDFDGKSSLADFELWKKARESEGFVFEPFPIQ